MKRLFAFAFLFFSLRPVRSLSPVYLACQLQKPSEQSPLAGCPRETVYVSPTDPRANFTSVQEAVDSLPQTGDAVILVGEGHYFEMVKVTRSAPLTLLGQLDPSTAYARGGNATQRNLVCIWNKVYAKEKNTDEETATFSVGPSYGHPFGNVDLKVYNINFENLAATYAISQALVTCITLANVSFYGCAFASWQDTFYAGYGASVYVVDSVIYGQVDYIFGIGVALFRSVILANRGCGGGITAWGGLPDTNHGVYIFDSRIIRSPDINASTIATESCFLGRPWSKYSVAVFLRNYMGDIIQPGGFTSWDGEGVVPNTAYFAEFGSHGPGGNTSARVPQCHILSAMQAENYTIAKIFNGVPSWIDPYYQY